VGAGRSLCSRLARSRCCRSRRRYLTLRCRRNRRRTISSSRMCRPGADACGPRSNKARTTATAGPNPRALTAATVGRARRALPIRSSVAVASIVEAANGGLARRDREGR
jgi:hypothetical protein